MDVNPALIILVEDNDDHAELTIESLKQNKVINEVIRFADAESAMDYISSAVKNQDTNKMPDLILLDVKLPGMSGFDMLQKLKSNTLTKRIPVIMLTTSSRDEEVAKGYDFGVNSYVVKPVNFTKFQEKLADLRIYWILISEMPKSTIEISIAKTVAEGEKIKKPV